ncbi:MAG: putative 2-dehydropantoate 2-reductase [Verrucomicrobiales bacterium]|nr:putative 2-dehydropantoate 2-reductase [Verrucomicrobiales bacterium]
MSTPNPLPPQPRIAIIGAGAVGGYYGGRLAQHGQDTRFLLRSDWETIQHHGLHLFSPQGDAHIHPIQAFRTPEEIGPCDLVIIALKATSNSALTRLIPPLLHADTTLLSLQNGLGSDAQLADLFGAHRILGGLCYVCINRTAPGQIHHLAEGRIALGDYLRPPQPRTHQIAALFQASGIDCHVVPDLATTRWNKLVWNIPFNGWSIAAGGLDTTALLADPHLRSEIREQMLEVIHTARHLGHDLPESLAESMIARTERMPPYRPSSLIDFEAGRDVELDAIWAAPLRLAAQHGLSMPRLTELHRRLSTQLTQRLPI